MNTDKINQLIEDSDMNQMQKNVSKGFIFRAKENEEKRAEARDLIEKVYGKNSIEDIPLISSEVIVFKVIPKHNDEWDTKYPYRSIYFKNEKWHRTDIVSPSFDVAFICYLENKYLGSNSRFSDFALRMLEIKIEE